ncbi:MAG: UbiA family prenyltransferase, partial [Fibrobacterota bacterium]
MEIKEHTEITVREKTAALLALFRFELPFFAGICVIVGEMMALGFMPPVKEALLGFLSVFLISANALILNDCFDLASDTVNRPDRPLPSGIVKPNEALILSIIISLLGFATSLVVSIELLLLAMCLWLVGFLYNWRLKRTGLWGNLMVSFSVGMTFMYGACAVGNPYEILVWFFCILAFFINLAEEIAADAMDFEGDQVAGSKSIAIVYGQKRALQISGTLFGGVIVLSFIPFIFN